jgi:hypothetical protein
LEAQIHVHSLPRHAKTQRYGDESPIAYTTPKGKKVSTDRHLFYTLDSKSHQPRLRAWGSRDHDEAKNPTHIAEIDPRGLSGPNPCGWPPLKAPEGLPRPSTVYLRKRGKSNSRNNAPRQKKKFGR